MLSVKQRNLYVITAAEFVAVSGFSVILPFLPYYVQDLGITDPEQIKLWSGWLYASQAIAMALIAPFWGMLADRYGRKVMVERAMFGGAVVFVGMALATSVLQLVLLRILQGFLTGTVPAAAALVAASSSRKDTGASMGLLQTGVFLGASLGPMAGGLIADTWGYQAAFWITSACLLLSGFAVHWWVVEEFNSPQSPSKAIENSFLDGVRIVLHTRVIFVVIGVEIVTRTAFRLTGPMLPLFVQEIAAEGIALATLTGLITGLGAFASAFGALLLGRLSDLIGHRKILLLSAFGMAACNIPQFLVRNTFQLAILQLIAGFLMAGVLATLSTLLALQVPPGRQGAVYGIDTTVVAGANALGPMFGTSVAIWFGLRPIFLVAAGLYALGGLIALVGISVTGRVPGEI